MKKLLSRDTVKNLSALCALAFAGNSMALDLNVVDLNVVSLNKLSETRVDRTTYDYVFSVTVKNGAHSVTNASQTLTAVGAGSSIIDGNVVLGNLAADEQVTPADTITIRHNRSLNFNQSALVWAASGTEVGSSSSAASSTANRVFLSEPFNIDKAALFTAAYRSISTDAAAPLLFVTGGNSGITIVNNELTLAGARFSIGHKPPRANTTASDTSANGDFDLSKPYRISFRVVASSGSGALQVMVDNNGTSAGNSLHGSGSRIFNASANSLVAGQTIELLPTVGTANSFVALRTESSATVTIDDLVIEYLDDVVTGSSSAPSSIAASSVAVSSTPASSSQSSAAVVASSVMSSSAAPSSVPATNQSSSSVASYDGALRPAKMEGFAAHAGVTGGAGGPVITVSTGTELNQALCGIRNGNRAAPVTILVNGTINHSNTTAVGCDTQADVIEIKKTSNVSIIGVGTNALFDQIGIHVRDSSNVIIQNVHIRNVKKSGSPTSNGGDAIGLETNVNRVWVDHNWLEASGGEKDGYDSLLDMKSGVTNVTVSYNKFNDSSRAGLVGFTDSDSNNNITFHHNWYKNIEQRTPLIRNALVHVYNNYWSNETIDHMFHAINSRAGAKALVESNYFYNVNNPLIASDDSSTPGCWQTNNDNTVLPYIYYSRSVGNGALVVPTVVDGQLQSTCVVSVPYTVEMDNANDVPAIVMANVGVGKISGGGVPTTSSSAASVAVSSVASSVASSIAVSSVAPSSVATSVASSEIASSEAASSNATTSNATTSESSSSVASAGNGLLINEVFNADKVALFSASYQSISTDASAALYFITGGGSGVTIANNQLTLAGARLTIGNRPPRASTTASDANANGDFDLTRPYRISFTVVAASGSGKVQVYVDNNTTSSGNAIHGANSKVFEAVASSLTAGQQVVITPALGTSNSFIALRTESSASVTIDNLVLEYIDGAGVSSSSVASVIASSQSSQVLSSVVASVSSAAVSSVPSSAIASSLSSASSSAPYIPEDVNLSADCINLATNPNVNWRDTALQTDQEIVECLSQSLGKPVGYGENAKGGFDPNGNSKLTIITKNSSVSVEQQLLDALTDNAHNWVVFDKVQFAQPHEIGMYRMYCSNPLVQSILDASEAECLDYKQWCARKGVSGEANCRTEFFNKAMNKSNIPIRIPAIGSNKTIDGRMSEAYFLFSGFAIGKDSDGVPTQTSESVIFTHLSFKGAGHTEDHYVDPDMIRSTGASHDIWIHKNTFDTTGDSAFDVKIGANSITMSFNRLQNVKRAVLHGSSDSRTINANITTTMHHNAFVTTDDSYMLLGNTLRRVPLLRRGKTHMFNNVFVNYRKEVLSLRVGAQAFLEDNAFVVNSSLQEKSSLEASLAEISNNYFKDISGGSLRNDRNFLWFGSGSCVVNQSTQTALTATSGTVANLAENYNAASLNSINGWRFAAGQDLVDYVTLTAGKYGDAPFNSPLSPDRTYMEALIPVSCQ